MSEPHSASATFDLALNMAQHSLYRFSALALVDPRAANWTMLANPQFQSVVRDAADFIRASTAAPDSLAIGELPINAIDPSTAFTRLPPTADELNAAYEQVFGLLVSGGCPPHGTDYIHEKLTFQRSQSLADISGFYRAFGLKISSKHPQRHDHIALELEFMAFLLGLERLAAQQASSQRQDRVDVCRSARERFFREHIVWWVPTFAKLLTLEDADGFYGAIGRFLAALIPAQRALLDVEAPSTPVTPTMLEPPEACEGCALADA